LSESVIKQTLHQQLNLQDDDKKGEEELSFSELKELAA
jgi:hypothetical protein